MRAYEKKKQFRVFCRDQVKKGLINQADGNWAPANSNKWQDNHMIAGYKLGRAK